MSKLDTASIELMKTKKDIKGLVRLLNEKSDMCVVDQVIPILAELGETMLPDIENWCSYPIDFTSSKRLLVVFGKIGPSAIPTLESWIHDSPPDTGGNGFLDTVIQIFRATKSMRLHTPEAVISLSYMGTPGAYALVRALQTRIEYLDGKPSRFICERIINIGEPAVEPLLGILSEEKLSNYSVRMLGEIVIKDATIMQQVIDALMEALINKKYDDADIIRALVFHGSPILCEMNLLDLNNTLGQEKLVQFLRSYKEPFRVSSPKVTYLPQLMSGLTSTNLTVRVTAVRLLGEAGYTEAINPLVEFLKDPDEDVDLAIAARNALYLLGWRDPSALASAFRGGLGEPYCSEACHKEGARYALMEILGGKCSICNRIISNAGGQRDYAVIPYEGKTLIVCNNCAIELRTRLSIYPKCCKCQKVI